MKLAQNIRTAFFLLLLAGAGAARLAPQQVNRLLAQFGTTRDYTSRHYTLVAGGVHDGDTLRVTDGRKEIDVRMCGIDGATSFLS